MAEQLLEPERRIRRNDEQHITSPPGYENRFHMVAVLLGPVTVAVRRMT